jgi:hypothetical protein
MLKLFQTIQIQTGIMVTLQAHDRMIQLLDNINKTNILKQKNKNRKDAKDRSLRINLKASDIALFAPVNKSMLIWLDPERFVVDSLSISTDEKRGNYYLSPSDFEAMTLVKNGATCKVYKSIWHDKVNQKKIPVAVSKYKDSSYYQQAKNMVGQLRYPPNYVSSIIRSLQRIESSLFGEDIWIIGRRTGNSCRILSRWYPWHMVQEECIGIRKKAATCIPNRQEYKVLIPLMNNLSYC